MSLLEVEDLSVRFYTEEGVVKATNSVSYSLDKGERLGVVGESGAGKSVLSLSLLRLIEDPGYIEEGSIRFEGEDILEMSAERLREIRGGEIAMIFQDPETALNPVYTVGNQIKEAIHTHQDVSDQLAEERAIELLEEVGIPDPEERLSDYPHQFSGGMQQRVVIAIALSCNPKLIICDEPTTALDVTIESQILELLKDLAESRDTAIQIITHDMGVIADICNRVMVLYAGKVVEKALVEDVFYNPKHPYTAGLLASIPKIGDEREQLDVIPGTMPDLVDFPPGCDFHPRCPFAEEVCAEIEPKLIEVGSNGHQASCLYHTGDIKGDLGYTVEVKGEE